MPNVNGVQLLVDSYDRTLEDEVTMYVTLWFSIPVGFARKRKPEKPKPPTFFHRLSRPV